MSKAKDYRHARQSEITVRIDVTAADIRKAIRDTVAGIKYYSPFDPDPLILAARRAFRVPSLRVAVCGFRTSKKPSLYIDGFGYWTAGKEAEFMRRWDAGDPVKPFSFSLLIDRAEFEKGRAMVNRRHRLWTGRQCWKCETALKVHDCDCGHEREIKGGMVCYTCRAYFCRECFPGHSRYGRSGHTTPDGHLSEVVKPFEPTWAAAS